MSKLDQIKALGDAKRAARMNPKRKQPEAKPTKSDDVLASDRVVTRRAMPRSVATTSENLDVTAGETAPHIFPDDDLLVVKPLRAQGFRR